MKHYEAPEMKVTIFAFDEVCAASSGDTESTKPTGGGGGVVLPDDDWT